MQASMSTKEQETIIFALFVISTEFALTFDLLPNILEEKLRYEIEQDLASHKMWIIFIQKKLQLMLISTDIDYKSYTGGISRNNYL